MLLSTLTTTKKMDSCSYTYWSLALLKNASGDMDVSLVLVTVLLEGMERWSDQSATHAATDVKRLKKPTGILTAVWGLCSASDCCRWCQTVYSGWLCICERIQKKIFVLCKISTAAHFTVIISYHVYSKQTYNMYLVTHQHRFCSLHEFLRIWTNFAVCVIFRVEGSQESDFKYPQHPRV